MRGYKPIQEKCPQCRGTYLYDDDTGMLIGCSSCGLIPQITIPVKGILNILHNVIYAETDQEEYMERLRIGFHNGYTLSIIRGLYSYGGDKGLYEIAIKDADGSFCPSLFKDWDKGDDVLGYCLLEKVIDYAMMLDAMKE